MKKTISFALSIFIIASAASCYRMPTDNDYSLIPTTNNRDYTRETNDGPGKMPGIGY